jgi:hypothetical protein
MARMGQDPAGMAAAYSVALRRRAAGDLRRSGQENDDGDNTTATDGVRLEGGAEPAHHRC